ncbi:MAG: hypothetical protein ACHQF2_09485 [Flavobacteriales bacterium]
MIRTRHLITVSLFLFFCLHTAVAENISTRDSTVVIAKIIVIGNEKTDEDIILREITFRSGDTVRNIAAAIKRSEANLVNMELFNYVKVSYYAVAGGFVDVLIEIKERWYFWPIPLFSLAETNFNTWWLTKDFRRANYGLLLVKKNFRGRNEDIAVKGQIGYSKELVALYSRPYLSKSQRLGFTVSAGLIQLGEITVATVNNKRVFFRSGHGRTRQELFGRLGFNFRNKFYWSHYLEFGYQNIQVVDTLTRFTNDYFFANSPHTEFPGATYVVRYDKRDNKGYPLAGWLVHGEIQKYGIAIAGQKNLNVLHATAYARNYFPVGSRWYAAWQLKYKRTFTNNLPYYFQRALGYDDFVRGFEYYVIDGQHFGLLKSNLKFNIVKPHVRPIEWLSKTNLYKFHYASYLNFYVDAGYVWDKYYAVKNDLANEMLYSFGVGLDVLCYYDKVMRFEYSFNSLMEHGFFIHFVQPI